MNTKFKLFSFSVLLMLTMSASLKAQLTPWYLSGNNVSAAADYLGANNASMFPVRFRHYVPSNLGRFEWYTEAGGQQQERMRLTNGGWLGINTIPAPFNGNPAMMLHVNNGGILSTGIQGANPNLGSGTRFMWVPSSASLRAGGALGSEWDVSNVGLFSFALGYNVLASGNYSFALGEQNEATADYALAGGFNNDALAFGAIAYGQDNVIDLNAQFGVALGVNNRVFSQACVALGNANFSGSGTQGSEFCVALGDNNAALGHDTFAVGERNSSDGTATFSIGFENIVMGFEGSGALGRSNTVGDDNDLDVASIALGNANTVLSSNAYTLGNNNTIANAASNALALGGFLSCDAVNTITLGYGLNTNAMVNNLTNSLMVGFNSNVPTLFVSGGDGNPGTFGNVGIGNITAPTQRLDVNGTARLRVMPNLTPDVLITGVEADAPGDYTLNYLSFTGDDGDFLNGNGEWTNISSLCDWNISGSNLVMGYTNACNEGNVGIGLNNPNSKLEVANTLSEQGTTVLINSTASGNVIHQGLRTNTSGGQDQNVAIIGNATATENGASCTDRTVLVGVAGIANRNDHLAIFPIGIYGEAAINTNACDNGVAGYFTGTIAATQLPIFFSDENLKTDIQPINYGLEAIMNLHPISYRYNTDLLPNADGEAIEFGISAQNALQVIPEIVEELPIPIGHDENGNPAFSDETYYGVNYIAIIPFMIGAFQEQQAQIEAQNAQINALAAQVNALSAQIAACCGVDGNGE